MNTAPSAFNRHIFLAATVLVLAVGLISCGPAAEVATFAGEAVKSMELGTTVFDDMPRSVLRRDCDANIEKRSFDFTPISEACVSDATEKAVLTEAKSEHEDLIAVQKVLIDYFKAIQELATYGKTTADASKKSDAASASSAASKLKNKLKTGNEADAVNSLGTLVVRVFSAGYRDRQIDRDMREADDSVAKITDALTTIVQNDYMFDGADSPKASFLNVEAHRMQEQFKDAQGSQLLLKLSWTDRVQKLLARNSSAQSYLDALEKIKGGHNKMAMQPGKLKAKDLAGVVQPYTSDLQTLIPKLEKSF